MSKWQIPIALGAFALGCLLAGGVTYLKVSNDHLEQQVIRLEVQKAHLDTAIEEMEAEVERLKS